MVDKTLLKLKLNGAHKADKDALTFSQVQALSRAGYIDISWSNNECASFGSDCLRYELFVNLRADNVSDEFHAAHYDEDGDFGSCTFLESGSDLTKMLSVIETHKRATK